jgi:hypothetical protein
MYLRLKSYKLRRGPIRSGISACAWGAEDFAACVAVPWAFGWPGQLPTDPTNAGSAPGINAGLNYGFRALAQVFIDGQCMPCRGECPFNCKTVPKLWILYQ